MGHLKRVIERHTIAAPRGVEHVICVDDADANEMCASSELRAEALTLSVERVHRPLFFIDGTCVRVNGDEFNTHGFR